MTLTTFLLLSGIVLFSSFAVAELFLLVASHRFFVVDATGRFVTGADDHVPNVTPIAVTTRVEYSHPVAVNTGVAKTNTAKKAQDFFIIAFYNLVYRYTPTWCARVEYTLTAFGQEVCDWIRSKSCNGKWGSVVATHYRF